jgi:hypothetical protein
MGKDRLIVGWSKLRVLLKAVFLKQAKLKPTPSDTDAFAIESINIKDDADDELLTVTEVQTKANELLDVSYKFEKYISTHTPFDVPIFAQVHASSLMSSCLLNVFAKVTDEGGRLGTNRIKCIETVLDILPSKEK